MKAIYLPWLHMHQPLIFNENDKIISNLENMLDSSDSRDQWDAKLMARSYKNPASWVKNLAKEGKNPKIAVDFSGILLESLQNIGGRLLKTAIDGEIIGNIIELWREVLHKFPDSFEFSGTAYAHCYFPVTPVEDWGDQIDYWRKVFCELFHFESTKNVKGFWLPEMGVPDADGLNNLVKLLRSRGYEWLILPIETLKAEKSQSYEKHVEVFCQPHVLRTESGEMTVIFRPRYSFIDQQGGCDANGIYNKCIEAANILKRAGRKYPALVVPASDGENGNVMMNHFFSDTFIPFFREKSDEAVSSMTVTQYLEDYPAENEIELETSGGSWLGNHSKWKEGDKRLKMKRKIEELSRKFHKASIEITEDKDAIRALLMSETSCYVYWNSDFWFDQGEKMIEFAYRRITGKT